MAVKKKNRIHIEANFSELDPTPDYVVGFVPILPERKRLTPDLNEIIRANEGSSRPAENCWIPLEREYKEHREKLSDALRELVGYFQPFHTKDLVLEMELVLPASGRHRSKYWPQDAAQTFLDAAKWTYYTADEKRLGLIDDCAAFADMHLSRRVAEEGEQTGVFFEIAPLGHYNYEMFCHARATTAGVEEQHALVERVVDRACEKARVDGKICPVTAPDRLVELDMALLADDDTPLAVDVGRYYVALRSAYSRERAARLAVFEQSALAMEVASCSDVQGRLAKVRAKADALGVPDGRLDLVDRRLSVREIDTVLETAGEA